MPLNPENIREIIVYLLKPLAFLYKGFQGKQEHDVDAALRDLDTAELYAEAILDYVEGMSCYDFLKELNVMELSNLYESLPASGLPRKVL